MINILTLRLCHVFFKTIVLNNNSNAGAMTFQRSVHQYKLNWLWSFERD